MEEELSPEKENFANTSQDSTTKNANLWSKVLMGAAVALIIGSFLPWATATVIFLGSITRSGIDGGDGWFSVLGGAILIFLAWKSDLRKNFLIGITVVVALMTVLVLFEIFDVQRIISDIDSEFGTVSVGFGLWLMLAACVAAWVAVVKLFMLRNEKS